MFTEQELYLFEKFIDHLIATASQAGDPLVRSKTFLGLLGGDPAAKAALSQQWATWLSAQQASVNAVLSGLDADRIARETALNADLTLLQSADTKYQALGG